LLVDQQAFTMVDLRSMIQGLLETVRLQLLTDVLLLNVDPRGNVRAGTTALPPLALDELMDQPAEAGAGYSFLKHPANPFAQWSDWLLQRVTSEPALRQQFGVEDQAWRQSAVHIYMKRVRRFKEGLFTLVHLSAGAPARGSEITSILCENSEDGESPRGVFIDRGLVAFVTTYHKGYSKSKELKTIHRFVPREVSELVVYYLGLARPFIVDVQRVQCGVHGTTPFMWEPPPERRADVEGESDMESGDESEGAGDESEGDDRDVEEDSEQDTPQRAAPPRVSSANPDGYWGTDRVRRVLREYTLEFLGAALGTRAWRHSYPAIHRNLGTDDLVRQMLDALYFNKELAVDETRAQQSGHTLHTEESNYGRSLTESPLHAISQRNQFRRVSEEWHWLLRFASVFERPGACYEEQNALQRKNQQLALQRWTTLASVDLKAFLQTFTHDPTATLRSQQEDALEAIRQRKLRILVVMGTGAGKSLLFMLPAAAIQSGYTVVIAPLNSLLDNLLQRCQRAGIPSAKWDGRRPPYWARLIFVTPEAAVLGTFSRFLDEKRAWRELDRIVIDKCHVLMESSHTWRPDVLKLLTMTEKDTQVVYLTATMPPSREAHFLQLAGLDRRTLTVCRELSTSRPNIGYLVIEHDKDDADAELQTAVDTIRDMLGPDAQIVVYCPSREETRRLGKLLRCHAFTSDAGTEEDKARRVCAFADGVDKLCTATSVLGLGLDAPGVRVVIHVAMASTLEQYVQESGRAGRPGDTAYSIVLVSRVHTKTGKEIRCLPYKLDKHATAFLDSTVCRRIAIDAHMDARFDRRQCNVGETQCDLCMNRNQCEQPLEVALQPASCPSDSDSSDSDVVNAHRAKALQLENTAQFEQARLDMQRRQAGDSEAFALERLEQHLENWRRFCVVCKATSGEHEDHDWQSCEMGNSKFTQKYVKTLGTGVKWQLFLGCPGCFVPQAICIRWEATDKMGAFQDRNDDSCQFKDVMLRAIAALVANQGPVFKK
jgi:superfamily II DNA helicase RecQ